MSAIRHAEAANISMHTLVRWTHATAVARLAEQVTELDVGKRSLQLDTLSFWDLASASPKVWVASGAGPGGGGGGGGAITKLSTGAISGGRVVRYADANHVALADAATAAHAGTVAGLSLTATSGADQELQVVRLGEAVDIGWAWTPLRPVYLGIGGFLTQTYSAAWAFFQIIGVALSATRIYVDPQDPVLL